MDDAEALSAIIDTLKKLDADARDRVFQSAQIFFGVQRHSGVGQPSNEPSSSDNELRPFSKDRTLTPKDFMRDKKPLTDVERAICLAYYLAYFRDKPHFKTVDISVLNTEAAQPKFSNASVAVDNARAAGLLVPAVKGNKQISAVGERYVELLPDRDAAREAVKGMRRKRIVRKSK